MIKKYFDKMEDVFRNLILMRNDKIFKNNLKRLNNIKFQSIKEIESSNYDFFINHNFLSLEKLDRQIKIQKDIFSPLDNELNFFDEKDRVF